MDDSGLFQIMLELAQPLGALLGGCVLIVTKIIIERIKELSRNISEVNDHFLEMERRFGEIDHKIEAMRADFQNDLKECQRREICASHRQSLSRRIDDLYTHVIRAGGE